MSTNGTAFADLLVPAAEVISAARTAHAECARIAVAIAQGWAADHHKLCHDCERTCLELGADIAAAILQEGQR